MIAPFAIGPMALGGLAVYIGESQASFPQADYFACALPMLIATYRSAFSSPSAWAVVVQIQGWIDGNLHQDNFAAVRDVQASIVGGGVVPRVASVTAVDAGDPTSPFHSIHPRYKRVLGERTAAAGLAFLAGLPAPTGPVYARAVTRLGRGLAVTIHFEPGSVGRGLVWHSPDAPGAMPSASCPPNVPRHTCRWFGIEDSKGVWHNMDTTYCASAGNCYANGTWFDQLLHEAGVDLYFVGHSELMCLCFVLVLLCFPPSKDPSNAPHMH